MLLFLSTADTDLLTIERALPAVPTIAPAVELGNPARPGTAERVAERLNPPLDESTTLPVAAGADPELGRLAPNPQSPTPGSGTVLVLRLHGGRRAAPELVSAVEAAVERQDVVVIALAGEAQPDPDLAALCRAPQGIVERVDAYLRYGGTANAAAMLRYLSDTVWGTALGCAPPLPQPEDGLYHPDSPDRGDHRMAEISAAVGEADVRPRIGVLFYRAHWLSGNVDFVDALVRALERHGCAALPVFCGTLRLPEGAAPGSHVLARYFLDEQGRSRVDAIISTLSFAAGRLSTPTIGEVEGATEAGGPAGEWLARLGVPVLQAIVCADSRDTWAARAAGLSPVDVAMQVALPEFDGRIVAVPVCFKEVVPAPRPLGGGEAGQVNLPPGPFRGPTAVGGGPTAVGDGKGSRERLDAPTIRYVPDEERCDALARQAAAWARLRRLPNAEKRIAVVLGNYPSRNGRIGNAVGLDTPASLVRLLQALDGAGYTVGGVPESGDDLIHRLIDAGTYDPEGDQEWGAASEDCDPPGLRFGNVFVGLQPPRGWEADPDAVYHDPELAPPPVYVAFYRWLRTPPPAGFGAYAVIHLGKHGTLEWLPGKAVGLSAGCAPDALLGDLPLVYPFIVDDPGEGTQAKRRAHAVLVGHMVPPLAPAGLYGELAELERLIQEEHAARLMDPPKLPLLRRQIVEAVYAAHLHKDLSGANGLLERAAVDGTPTVDRLLACIEAHLADLRSATIRDGLHVLGQPPVGGQRRTTLDAMLRLAPADQSKALRARLEPLLDRTEDELHAVLAALAGRFVPAGPSGAPTRGAWNVLPTGRNFYAVDPQAIPSRAAWETGCRLAGALLARHLQEAGRYPRTVGLVVWGTATMRTHGDDVAQALALLGVRPVWQPETGRVTTIEPIPLAELGRPRVDVTLHISGFFRDAFPHLVALLDRAVQLVAGLDEPDAENYVAVNIWHAAAALVEAGEVPASARRRAGYRLFGSKPGCYGAGLLPLIDSRRWRTADDLARAYETWTAHAYGQDTAGEPARDAFRSRFAAIEVAAKNQDNREHDLFDSDDYFQYQGGMVAAVRALRGEAPRAYLGDSSDPARPAMRSLQEEARRVFRTRVVNPRWLAAMRRHGYKGAFELAATVDYLFGYDATTGIVDDLMYERVAQAYALDPEQQAFFARSNPWALRDVAERLLEAAERGLWQHPTPGTLDGLRRVYLRVDGDLEGTTVGSGGTK